jgi:hypothetical protein
MEPTASQAAVNAIAALQRKVKVLEDEATALAAQKVALEQDLRLRDSGYQKRELVLKGATTRAQQMFKNATAAVQENEELYAENRRLKSEIELIQKCLHASRSPQRSVKGSTKQVKSQASKLLTRIDEYEILLSEFLAVPPHRCSLTRDEASVILSAKGDRDPILPDVDVLMADLREMPTDLSNQDMKTKRKIARALSHGMSAVTDLNNAVRRMELQQFDTSAPKRYQTEIRRLSAAMLLLCDEVMQFHFDVPAPLSVP